MLPYLCHSRHLCPISSGEHPSSSQSVTGYFWAIARDDRPWGGADPPAVVYTYAPGRGGEHLEKLLAKPNSYSDWSSSSVRGSGSPL
jgi:hypothetical protein